MPPAYDRLEFESDGHLTVTSMLILGGLEGREFGDALAVLLARARDLPPDQRAVACEAIEDTVSVAQDEGRAIDVDSALLVATWRSSTFDPSLTDVARLAVRLILTLRFGALEIFGSLPGNAEGQALRERLDSDLRNASARAEVGADGGAEPEAAPDDDNLRSIDFPEANGGDHGADGAAPAFETDRGEPPVDPVTPGTAPDAVPPDVATPGPEPTRGLSLAPDPPRTYRAHGLLACDEVVLVGRPFELTLGLSERPTEGVAGSLFMPRMPDPSGYFMDVQLFADGFDLSPGEAWRHSLEIRPDSLFPTVTVHLTPRALQDDMAAREIGATFSVEGKALGFAKRYVRVTTDAAELPMADVPVAAATGVNIATPGGDPPADLTITIKKGLEPGALLWSLESPLPRVGLNGDAPATSSIGGEPDKFAMNLIRTLFTHGSAPGLFEILRGRGRRIRRAMPDAVMTALSAAAAATSPEPPQILLLTDEPYVPWELAIVDNPWFDDAPPFLAAQANVGRWILVSGATAAPPRAINASTMAVVWGVYSGPTLPRLVAAEEEAQELTKQYRAASVNAEGVPVRDVLNGTPPADILHFAVHGKFDPQTPTEGIQLIKGPPVVPDQIVGSDLTARAPFVFLNACQIGSAQTVLGGYGGVAHAFLEAGASAVVAPLWSIDDKIAKGIALGFYKHALAAAPAGAPTVAGLLREARHGFFDTAEAPSATYLAYQFYGHPSLRLKWEGASDG